MPRYAKSLQCNILNYKADLSMVTECGYKLDNNVNILTHKTGVHIMNPGFMVLDLSTYQVPCTALHGSSKPTVI